MPNAETAHAPPSSPGAQLAASPILVDAAAAAALLGISKGHFHNLRSTGSIPLPIRLGGSVRWPVEELRSWSRAGCPPRERWAVLRESAQ